MTTFAAHQFPGLPNPVYLPDWIPVEIKIIPSTVAGWTSGQKIPVSSFTSTTWHDTGNKASAANGEWDWAAGGGRALLTPPFPGSYNGIFDGTKIIICQRFDELVGHAANHTGNITSYAFEQAGWGPDFDFDKSWEVGTWLHAGVLHAMGKTAKAAMYQHNHWSGKDCPGEIRRRGIWSKTEDTVDAHIAEIKAFLAGGSPAPVPPVQQEYATPVPIREAEGAKPVVHLSNGATLLLSPLTVEAVKDTPRLQYAANGAKIGPDIKEGETFPVRRLIINPDGSQYWYTRYATRVRYQDTKIVGVA